jgi:cytochrome b561
MGSLGRRNLNSGHPLQWAVGGCIVSAGVASQIGDTLRGGHLDTHFLFGVLLSIGVICRFRYGLWTREPACLDEIRVFARHVTRSVYLFLYALLAVKLLLNLGGATVTPPDMFRPYLAAGLAAILLTQVLALFSAKPIEGAIVN